MSLKKMCSDNTEYCHDAEGRFKVENLENTVTYFSVLQWRYASYLAQKLLIFKGRGLFNNREIYELVSSQATLENKTKYGHKADILLLHTDWTGSIYFHGSADLSQRQQQCV